MGFTGREIPQHRARGYRGQARAGLGRRSASPLDVRAGAPVHSLLLERRLVDQHAETVDGAGAHGIGADQPAPCAAGGTRGRRRPVRACNSVTGHGRSTVAASPAITPMPTLVALTTMSARADVVDARRPLATRARLAASAARSAVRLTTAIEPAPARPSASTTERAAPPAPMTATLAPATSMPISVERRDEPGAVGAGADQCRRRPNSRC